MAWFKIRRDLDRRRGALLTLCSFLLPLGLWCVVSYTPWIWHPDIRLEISADRNDVVTVYASGDHVRRDFFPTIVEAVRVENTKIAAYHNGSTEWNESGGLIRRANQKKLRHLAPLAVEHGWLEESETSDDAAVFEIWKNLATGTLETVRPALTEENTAVVQKNWALLSAESDVFDRNTFPEVPLYNLIPQGKPANPVYVPAPDRVWRAGLRDFTRQPTGDRPSMAQRFAHSLRIIFGGFLLSCVFGIPLGILCGSYAFFSKLFEPFIDFFRYMPAPAFSTLLVAVFLAGDAPKIALVFVGTFFQLVLVVAKTTRQLDPALLEAAQTLGAKPGQLLARVVVPGILPDLYNDLRILLGWAWTWLVIAELVGVKSGLTEFIETQGRFRNFDSVFPVIILIGVTGFCTDQLLAFLRAFLFPWTGAAGPRSRAVVGAVTWLPRRAVESFQRLPRYERSRPLREREQNE